MTYIISLVKRGPEFDWYFFKETLLDGFIPSHVLDMMEVCFVDSELGLCDGCEFACKCHIILEPTGKKLCTLLFHDAVRPKWRLKDVI